jgi:hypothetical protein
MKPETLQALLGSIDKWEKIVDGSGVDQGSMNCALCARFVGYSTGQSGDCTRHDGEICPVALATGRAYCQGSPYEDWVLAVDYRSAMLGLDGDNENRAGPSEKATDGETVMCAVLELEFLRSLLPESEGAKRG